MEKENHIWEKDKFLLLANGVRGKTLEAIEKAGLDTTRGLCHEVNYSVAIALSVKSKIPLLNIDNVDFRLALKGNPVIAYVYNGSLDRGRRGWIPHSFLVVLGFDKPIFIDGANDQKQKRTPFLISELNCETSLGPIRGKLLQKNRGIEVGSQVRVATEAIKVLEDLINEEKDLIEKLINESGGPDIKKNHALEQFKYESEVGLGFMVFLRMRDWIEYFLAANEISYPSIQDIVDKIFRYTDIFNPNILGKTGELYANGRRLIE